MANSASLRVQKKASNGSSEVPSTQLPSFLTPSMSWPCSTSAALTTSYLSTMNILQSSWLKLPSSATLQAHTGLVNVMNMERWAAPKILHCQFITMCVISSCSPSSLSHTHALSCWQNIAAQQNHRDACFALTAWYLVGSPGVLPQSDTEAFLWAQKAAEAGLAKAMYACGYFLEVGIGTSANVQEYVSSSPATSCLTIF